MDDFTLRRWYEYRLVGQKGRNTVGQCVSKSKHTVTFLVGKKLQGDTLIDIHHLIELSALASYMGIAGRSVIEYTTKDGTEKYKKQDF